MAPKTTAPYTIKSKHDTVLKARLAPSAVLAKDEKIEFMNGEDLAALAVSEQDLKRKGHVKVTFDFTQLPSDKDRVAKLLRQSGRNTWYIFYKHINVNGTEPDNKPKDEPSTKLGSSKDKGGPLDFNFKLPGFKSTFNMSKPIQPGHRNYWYEALHFDPNTKRYRPPESKQVVYGTLALDKAMDEKIRPYLAKHYGVQPKDVSISYNSWYRDPATNRAVGGASRSRHLVGDAVDFNVYVKGQLKNPYEILDILNPMWTGGLASASVFVHADARPYKANWTYGF